MQVERCDYTCVNYQIGRLQKENIHADQIRFGDYFGLSAAGWSDYGPGPKPEPAGRIAAGRKVRGCRYRRATAATDRDGGPQGAERDCADPKARGQRRAAAAA